MIFFKNIWAKIFSFELKNTKNKKMKKKVHYKLEI